MGDKTPPGGKPVRKMSGRLFVILLLASLVLVGYGLRVAIQMGQPELVEETR